jgi:hypothetical protein
VVANLPQRVTEAVAERFRAGDAIADLCIDYGMLPSEVEDVLRQAYNSDYLVLGFLEDELDLADLRASEPEGDA